MTMPDNRSFTIRFTAAAIAVLVSSAALGAPAPQQRFASPGQAADALIEADIAKGSDKLLRVLGPDAKDLVTSGDPVADAHGRQKFAAAYDARHVWEDDGANRKILIVGPDRWPLPIPLVLEKGQWRFDTKAGRAEILTRRIGRNELKVMDICRAIVLAEKDYADQNGGDKPAYAPKFVSAPGKHDGLYWPVKDGEAESPLGPLVAQAADEGYPAPPHKQGAPKQRTPYHGYFYRLLKAQGPAASGGAKNFVVKGRMTGGFAVVAYPAKYGDSGIRTFIVNQTGIIYEKDLGPRTAEIVAHMTQYNPDKGWQIPQADSHLND